MIHYLVNKIKDFLMRKLQTYMANEYIHKDRIREAMKEHLKRTENTLNKIRDEQEEMKLLEADIKYKIQEDAYLAEIARLELVVDESLVMRKEVMKLKYELERRSKEYYNFISISEADEKKILSNVCDSVGSLESLRLKYKSFMDAIDKSNAEEREVLRLNG